MSFERNAAVTKIKDDPNYYFRYTKKFSICKTDIGPLMAQILAKEITPVVHFIFTQTLCTGELPTEWTQANVAPIFKKGSMLQAVNYRPVSLTYITCKLFEHIICKHILAHLDDHNILTGLQHGFRSG